MNFYVLWNKPNLVKFYHNSRNLVFLVVVCMLTAVARYTEACTVPRKYFKRVVWVQLTQDKITVPMKVYWAHFHPHRFVIDFSAEKAFRVSSELRLPKTFPINHCRSSLAASNVRIVSPENVRKNSFFTLDWLFCFGQLSKRCKNVRSWVRESTGETNRLQSGRCGTATIRFIHVSDSISQSIFPPGGIKLNF